MLTSIYKRKGRAGVTLAYEDETGRVRQKQFPTRTKAIDFRDHLRAAARKQPVVSSDITFPDYAVRWLRATKTAVRAGTYRNYEATVRVHLTEAFPGKLRDITRGQVRDLIVQLRTAGMMKKSARNIRGALHAILEAAVEDELISINPARFPSKSKLMSLTVTAGEARAAVKAFDLEQARAFLVAADLAAPRHAMLFRTMLATGLRPGEAIALRPEDLEYDARRIRVVRAITRGRIEPCKTAASGEAAYVDMPAALAEELRAWEAACASEALSCGRSRPEWLFPGSTGGLRPRSTGGHLDDTKRLSYAFTRVLRKAGLPLHFSPHCLRHTYATHQLINGESIYYVQRQLRHADIRMTAGRYGSWLPASNREAADRHYERLVGGPPGVTSHKR